MLNDINKVCSAPNSITKQPCLTVMKEWHKDRRHYCVWLAKIETQELLELTDTILNELHERVEIIKPYQLHMTLYVSGFIVNKKVYNDDITRKTLANAILELSKYQLDTIKLKVTGISYDIHLIYFSVDILGNSINKIRAILGEVSKEIIFDNFFPHITIGCYKSNIPLNIIANSLDKYRHLPFPIELNIKEVECVRFDAITPAVENIGICKGEFITIAKFSLD